MNESANFGGWMDGSVLSCLVLSRGGGVGGVFFILSL
jgi:hypothetical protein